MADTWLVVEQSAFSFMARIEVNGSDITVATVSSISWTVFYKDTTEVFKAESSLTPSNVVYDTLQTDGRWALDSDGYNFRHDISSSVFTNPDRQYQIEYVFTSSDGTVTRFEPVAISLSGVSSV